MGKEVKSSEVVEILGDACLNAYQKLIQAGVAKECARFVLPQRTQTRLYMKGNVRSWIHYLQIRHDHHTQKEHFIIAQEIKTIFINHFPNISKSLGFIL
jgi:thymidylate synthase (FAD)